MGNENNNSGQEGTGTNPAYQHILDVIPDSLHSLVIPELKKWDAGVTQKFQEIHNTYAPLKAYQKFVDNNIDPDYAEQSVILADELQRDPGKTIKQINETWGLGFIDKEQAQALQEAANSNSGENDEFDLDFGEGVDVNKLLEHPSLKQLKDGLEKLTKEQQEQRQREEEEAELEEFEQYLTELENSYTSPDREGGPLPFNRIFVTALMQQGIDGDEAVKQYHQVLAGNSVTPPENNSGEQGSNSSDTPVVMGQSGTAGSGTADEAINFGKLSKDELNSTIENILAQAQESGQG